MSLSEKIRKAREHGLEVEGLKLTIRRPTDYEAATLGDATFYEIASKFVVGWSDVLESDIAPGGDGVQAKFSADLWAEVLADRPTIWSPVAVAVIDAYKRHRESIEAAEKKS